MILDIVFMSQEWTAYSFRMTHCTQTQEYLGSNSSFPTFQLNDCG